MSTIEQVRAAEKRVREITEALKKRGAKDPNDLSTKLKEATDEYARVVRELNSTGQASTDGRSFNRGPGLRNSAESLN
jgi:succinate dehydrogenase/fumarate reductase flavoprotein subunit